MQIKVCEYKGCHAFDNHGSADGNTRIVPSLGGKFTILVTAAGGLLQLRNCSGRLEGHAAVDRFPVGDAAKATTRVVCTRVVGVAFNINFIVVLAAVHACCGKATANFKTLACRDGKHRLGEERVKSVKHGLAEGGRDVFHEECNCSANAIAFGLRLQDGLFHLGTSGSFWAADGGCFDLFKCELAHVEGFDREFDLYERVEKLAPEVIGRKRRIYKGVASNVDFYSGLLYSMLDIPCELYTPLFATARIAGWSAHRLEELINMGKIIRPAYMSISTEKEYTNLRER